MRNALKVKTVIKGVLLVLVVTALAVAAAGCGGSEDNTAAEAPGAATTPAEATTAEATTEAAATTEPAAPAFEGDPIRISTPYADFFVPPAQVAADACETETGIPSEVVPVDATYDDHNLKIQVEAQAGNAPDLAVQGLNTVIPMGANDFAVDLAPLIADLPEFSSDVMPLLPAGEVDGRLVAIPWGASLPVLWINTDLFRAAGLDPEAPLETWSDLAEAAEALTDPSKDQYGLAVDTEGHWIALQFLLLAGTNLLGEDGTPAFNNADGVEAATFLNGLYASGFAFPGDAEQAITSFVTGKSAILITSTSLRSTIAADAKFEASALPFPAQEAGSPVNLAVGGTGIAMFATEDRREAAFQVLRCLFQLETLQAVGELGYLPVRTDLQDELLAGVADQPPYAAALSQYSSAVPWYSFPGPDGIQALTIFVDSWNEATQRSDDPAAVLNDAAATISPLLP